MNSQGGGKFFSCESCAIFDPLIVRLHSLFFATIAPLTTHQLTLHHSLHRSGCADFAGRAVQERNSVAGRRSFREDKNRQPKENRRLSIPRVAARCTMVSRMTVKLAL